MRFFDEFDRTDTAPARYAQPHFDFVNRSAWPEAAAVRGLLEEWFEEFPGNHTELRGRFRSPDNRQHLGAFFEVYLNALLRRMGLSVYRPEGAGSSKTTDFLVSGKETSFWLEATLAAASNEEAARLRRVNRVYDTIEGMDSPNFFVGVVEVTRELESDPPGAKLRAWLTKELAKLNPDSVAAAFEAGGLEALPTWDYEAEGWEIRLQAIPKSPAGRGKPGVRPIGYRRIGPMYVECRKGIVSALGSKATRYGEMDGPYVVAVNVLDDFADEKDIADALFGEPVITVRMLPDGRSSTEQSRRGDGVWWGPNGVQNTRVSGILAIERFSYWNIARRVPVLWHNPWAQKPLRRDLWPFEQMAANENTGALERKAAVRASVADLLGVRDRKSVV